MIPPRRPSPSRLLPLALLGALALGPACKGEETATEATPAGGELPPAPAEPTPVEPTPTGSTPSPTTAAELAPAERGEVVATLQLPSGIAMTDVAAVIDAVQPGASIMLQMQSRGLLQQLVGFDLGASATLEAPLSVVILDPTSHPKPFALLVEVRDAAALRAAAKTAGHVVEQRDALALVGPAGVVAAAKDVAFARLTTKPARTELVVYPGQLLRAYEGTIAQGLAQLGPMMAATGAGGEGMSTMVRRYVEGIVELGKQIDRMVIHVEAGPGRADLITELHPVAGSTLASFVAAQVPSDHALIAKLPPGNGNVLMSGNLHAGPARDAFVDFAIEVMGPMYGGMAAEEWRALMDPWLEALDGRFAANVSMAMAPGGAASVQLRTLLGASDSSALWGSWRSMLTKMAGAPAFEVMGMKLQARHERNVLAHDGVEVDLYATELDTSALPAEQAAMLTAAGSTNQAIHFAAFDDVAVMTSADADGQGIRALIDGARRKSPTFEPSPMLSDALKTAQARGDSMVMFMDLAALVQASTAAPPPSLPFAAVSFTMGKQDAALSVRVSLIK